MMLWLAFAGAMIAGGAARASRVLAADFPLNDGGMFYAMMRDLQAAHLALPEVTSYNSLSAPYAYPPLGFYAGIAVAGIFHISLLDTLRFVPLAASCLCLPAFWLLASSLFPENKVGVTAATLAFGLIPRSFIWTVMGGGLTRAPGFLFALLAIWQIQRLLMGRPRAAHWSSLFASLTLLSHLEGAMFLASGVVALWLAQSRTRQAFRSILLVAAVSAMATAPWWVTVLARFGPGPFVAAMHSGANGLTPVELLLSIAFRLVLAPRQTAEATVPILGALALLGAYIQCRRRCWLLPGWWTLIIVLEPRAAATYAAVPEALLAGVATSTALPALIGRAKNLAVRRMLTVTIFGSLLAYCLWAALLAAPRPQTELTKLVALSPGERAAMTWLAGETPASSAILSLTPTTWETDKSAEWLPVLAHRTSVATVQATEWLPSTFQIRTAWATQLARCRQQNTGCLEQWAEANGQRFDYLYVPKQASAISWGPLRTSLEHDSRYSLVYDGIGARIYRHAG